MVKPPDGTNEKVRARILELTGEDPGEFDIKDIFPGPEYHTKTADEIAEALAQSMIRVSEQDDKECPMCGDGDKVPARGYWQCPVCDAEWDDNDQQGSAVTRSTENPK